MPQLLGVGLGALKTIYAHLRERETHVEGSERTPTLISPRPQALDRDEKIVLKFLASRGDYADRASGGKFKWRGLCCRDTTRDEIERVLDLTSLNEVVCMNRPNKKSRTRNGRRNTGDMRKATKTEIMEELHEWLFSRPNLSPSRWIDGEVGGRVGELFEAYVRERRDAQPMTPVTDHSNRDNDDDGYAGNDDDDGYAGNDDVNGHGDNDHDDVHRGNNDEHRDATELVQMGEGEFSDIGSDTGEAQSGAAFEDSLDSLDPDMDESVVRELSLYEGDVVKYAPKELRGRLSYFVDMAKDSQPWEDLVSDVVERQDISRLVKGNIPSNWGIWAKNTAPDQTWSRHGWTQNGAGWVPPQSSVLRRTEVENLPKGDHFGSEFGKFALRCAVKMIPQEFVSCLVNRSNERLHYERAQMQSYARWLVAKRAGLEPQDGDRAWTYMTSAGEEKRRALTPVYLYDTDVDGRPLFDDIRPIEMLRYIGLLIACRARSGRVSMNILSESQSSLLAWSRSSTCTVLNRQRRQGIAYLLSGDGSYVNAFALNHQASTGCLSAGAKWRFHEAYSIFNRACLEHAPRPIYHVSYDEFRHGYDGRLPLGMKRPALHKAQGEGYDELMMCCQGGYRLYGELDFGSSKWANADELRAHARDGRVKGVPRNRRILRIAKRIKPIVERWCHIFADNLFTKLGSIRALYREEFFYTGTTKRQAVNFGIPQALTEWEGTSGEHTALYDVALREHQACACAWRDHQKTRTVLTISSFYRAEEASHVSRWDREVSERVLRNAPAVIPEYNTHMGYVDLHSQIAAGTLTCRQRTKRWTHAAFCDMMDSQLANAFVIANRELAHCGIAAVDHREFLCVLAHIFCDVPASGSTVRKELDMALRTAYGLNEDDGPDEDLVADISTDDEGALNGEMRIRGRQTIANEPLFKRINHPSRLIGIAAGLSRGHGADELCIHWPLMLPDNRIVEGVKYPKNCPLCISNPQGRAGRIKFACAICRISACQKHFFDIHGVELGAGNANYRTNYREGLRQRYRRISEEDAEEAIEETLLLTE